MKRQIAVNDRVAIALEADGVAQVRLTRSDKLNALDQAMIDGLISAGEALFDMAGLRCVVLAGEGRGFCAGLDTSMFGALLDSSRPPLTERSHGNANVFQQIAMQWRKLPVPVIAAVHGICFGGGLQIAAGADIRFAAPDTRLAVMEMKWGIIPDMGGFALWRGLVREDALRELTYTAREFSGEEAQTLGFVTTIDPNPVARATALARTIAGQNPGAVRAAKALFNRAPDMALDELLMAESIEQQKLLGTRNQIEAVSSQREGRPPLYADP